MMICSATPASDMSARQRQVSFCDVVVVLSGYALAALQVVTLGAAVFG